MSSKIIRLTENDLRKIVTKVIREQEEEVMVAVAISPEAQRVTNQALSQLSPAQLNDLKNVLNFHGINQNSDLDDIKDTVEEVQQSSEISSEMMETEEDDEKGLSKKEKLWKRVSQVLAMMGVGNLFLFSAPFALLYENLIGSGVLNLSPFQISSFVSTLLLMVAGAEALNREKKYGKKDSK